MARRDRFKCSVSPREGRLSSPPFGDVGAEKARSELPRGQNQVHLPDIRRALDKLLPSTKADPSSFRNCQFLCNNTYHKIRELCFFRVLALAIVLSHIEQSIPSINRLILPRYVLRKEHQRHQHAAFRQCNVRGSHMGSWSTCGLINHSCALAVSPNVRYMRPFTHIW